MFITDLTSAYPEAMKRQTRSGGKRGPSGIYLARLNLHKNVAQRILAWISSGTELVTISEDASDDTDPTESTEGSAIRQEDKPGSTNVAKLSRGRRAPHAPQKPTTMLYLQ